MAPLNLICFVVLAILCAVVHGAVRVERSPQFGGFAQSQAQAQAGGGGFGGFGGPRPYPPRPIFGPPRQQFGGIGGPGGFARPGGSISISKSISISAGGSQSSASSSASGK